MNVIPMRATCLTNDMLLDNFRRDIDTGEETAEKVVIVYLKSDGAWGVRSNTTVNETAAAAIRLQDIAMACVASPVEYA